MNDKVIAHVQFEIGQIDQLFQIYDTLLRRAQQGQLDLIETTAVASDLHSFDNGLENIFLAIAKGVDKSVPSGSQWHRDLLNQMTQSTTTRESVLTTTTAMRLSSYLAFRHFYRHSYSFTLEWAELEELVKPLSTVWYQTKGELQVWQAKSQI